MMIKPGDPGESVLTVKWLDKGRPMFIDFEDSADGMREAQLYMDVAAKDHGEAHLHRSIYINTKEWKAVIRH